MVLTFPLLPGGCHRGVLRQAPSPSLFEAECDSGESRGVSGTEQRPPRPSRCRCAALLAGGMGLTDLQRGPHRLPLPLLGVPDGGRHLWGERRW